MYQAGDIMEPSMTAQKIKVRTILYKKTNSETTVKIRAHVCSICGRMFAYQRALRKHIQSRHPETENAYEGRVYYFKTFNHQMDCLVLS